MTTTTVSVLPLTTIFAPPPSCFQVTEAIQYTTEDRSVPVDYLHLGPISNTAECMPPGWNPTSFFSPGICPNGYTIATSSPTVIDATATETRGYCCPEGFYFDHRTLTIHGLPVLKFFTTERCSMNLVSTPTVTGASADMILPQGAEVEAYGVSIRWRSDDCATSSSVPTGRSSKLSAGAKSGIGIGVTVSVFLFIIFALVTFHLRRRPLQKSAHDICDGNSDLTEKKTSSQELSDQFWDRWESMVLDSWFYEIVAMCFSISCFIAMVCVLCVYDQQSAPRLPHGLKLNTIVSVLSAGSKSSLIFVVGECIGQLRWICFQSSPRPLSDIQFYENAIRGPWGSFLMLLQDKCRSLVTIGALVTVLALALDPFVQQILAYPIRPTESHLESAVFKRSTFIHPQTIDDARFLDAVNVAFWSDDFPISPTCPSGNCTWPVFQSVEMCSKCELVTSQATLSGCYPAPFDSTLHKDQSMPCNVSLHFGNSSSEPVSIFPTSEISFEMTIPEKTWWQVETLRSKWPNDLDQSSIDNMGLVLSNTTRLGVTNPLYVFAEAGFALNYSAFEPSHPENGLYLSDVTECILSSCARTYKIAVSGGVPSTTVISEDYGEFYVPGFPLPGEDKGNSSTVCWKPSSVDSMIDKDQMSGTKAIGFCLPLNSILKELDVSGAYLMEYEWKEQNSSEWSYKALSATSQKAQRIMDTSLEQVMHCMAKSLSQWAREIGNETVLGSVATEESYVAVEWAWLTLPATLVLLGIVMLFSTMLLNKCRKMSVWKASVLPLLYHGLDYEFTEEDRELVSASKMDRSARKVDVKLGISDKHNCLVLRSTSRESE